MFYSCWIQNYSLKIHDLNNNTIFPQPTKIKKSFEYLKSKLERAVVYTIDKEKSFEIETDASYMSLVATLNQGGRSVASRPCMKPFFRREGGKCDYQSNKRMESLSKHFIPVTDQKALSYIFDKHKALKIENDKTHCRQIELSPYRYGIRYRPGKKHMCRYVNGSKLNFCCNYQP